MKDGDSCNAVPTITDVARVAGVSRATAARVLGGYGTVREKTCERVLDAAKHLAYHPTQLARSMATGLSKTIGVIIPDIQNPNLARAIRAIMDTASAHSFTVILATTDEDIALERDAIRSLLAKRVDGLIITPTSSSEIEHLANAWQRGYPVVLLERRIATLRADTFAVDNFGASYEAAKSLILRGHSNVALVSEVSAHVSPQALISPVREWIEGYRAALHDAEIPFSPNLVVLGGWDPQNLAQRVRVLCASPDRPTAFLATNSSAALLLLGVLRNMNLSIPEDVSLICFDNADWTDAVAPPLTVISQPVRDLAVAATEHLIGRLKGKPSTSAVETLMSAVLIHRASVGDALHSETVLPKSRDFRC
ncbi:LacI family DNA-binding transcriptional regulator [Agrobacterium tumefaciens]|uniref:LacI family DNA-binding transcriptional regulator n=1 Tax=Agrobacterium tumefaciens TaxID=358 RepID=UPI0015745C6B|nr:LacI family DNA-binding transcriptional regulator [Agrobacterium tumefaciens]WCK69454.1 LacI family DNA-binding transcriptional regulator [Agrobacterium tumefaciens]